MTTQTEQNILKEKIIIANKIRQLVKKETTEKEILKEKIDKIMKKYIGAYFNAVQEVLNKKKISNDINLDIEMKIFSKVHHTLVEVNREIEKLW